ncbi:glycosyltransferase family 39 protein [Nocardioides xinjiangensis]|uniref:glycosyltransferase family 39 protein n=1 Tax=Nocardioides xinjiangensis TaxID=2817376 RepID=UPI001B3142BB|nr:glycosyltransferase family 39 protein [Nocardioides sp. SYSU D00514]
MPAAAERIPQPGTEHPVRQRPDRAAAWLVAVVVAALVVRLVGLRHGLPHAYNADEELHFVPHAAAAADGDWSTGYFENPTGLTYLLALVFRAALPGDDATALLADDPGLVLTVARLVVAVLGTATVLVVGLAGRRAFGAAAGTWAAAFVGLSFLPVFYAHHALNDAATMLPVALGLLACLRLHEHGGTATAAVAGAAIGVATGTKYLAAPMVAVVALALAMRVAAGRQRLASGLRDLGVAAVACLVGLLALNPFVVVHAGTFWRQVTGQSAQAATGKLGQTGSAWLGYPATLLWGLGLVPVLLAIGGLALAWRRERQKAVLLLALPVLLYLWMASHDRWFARWMLPAYPALAVLAGLGAARTADALRRRLRGRTRPVATALLAVVALAQPVAGVVRSDRLLLSTDTRAEALAFLVRQPGGGRIVVEPAVPESYRRELRAAGWQLFPVERPFQRYEIGLHPGLLDTYRAAGRCWVMVNSHQRDRGLAAGLTDAAAYYARLAAEGRRVLAVSPYEPGVIRPEFSYDFSFNYYPSSYDRPGPVVELHRLDDCAAAPVRTGPTYDTRGTP